VFAYGEMLIEETPETLRSTLSKNVLTGATRGRALVEQILAYSRSQLASAYRSTIGQFVAETLELLRGLLPAAIRLEASAPPFPLVVIGDATQLHQVAMNLCQQRDPGHSAGGTLRVTSSRGGFRERALSNGTLRPGPYVRLNRPRTADPAWTRRRSRASSSRFSPPKEIGRGTGPRSVLVYAIVGDTAAPSMCAASRSGTTFYHLPPRARDALVTAEEAETPLPRANGRASSLHGDGTG